MINSWVKKATDNLIDSVISTSDINANTDLVLANAVYFKGPWLEQFNHFTERGTFHRLNGDLAEAEFMVNGLMTSSIRWQDIACMDGFKGCQLKRRRGHGDAKSKDTLSTEVNEGTQYSMFIFLPDARDGLSTMVDMVTTSPSYLYGILNEMEKKLVNIKLPKFEITFSWSDPQARP
ncbi:unnamed protein product [Miscanthus lutarioriparius]|uniref:Serpin domain-containing protein n=1 Tax=Miscanthus lutarioriparius TaxID=422564 RepID=A0A811QBD6_9POAL|nr:unnamed protein product [Miscanthus lutarioriparius]